MKKNPYLEAVRKSCDSIKHFRAEASYGLMLGMLDGIETLNSNLYMGRLIGQNDYESAKKIITSEVLRMKRTKTGESDIDDKFASKGSMTRAKKLGKITFKGK